ncbi:hypothetical protein BBBOND_0309980 [Babesia bigemina]|uniref:C3H1-type domain-containing protein n=1 Tax=Babesia bigemina TaxID=5866 RepID=A0A061DED6_BABBI|nr:hypothetical protein BBBOND_0309980 [Babesia bigemina]CDR97095.1 hypothetical protein BBBOND_0309980 [Babesia bigemina]|eukprot:XP_012769281.1 hypothetical protein BBBOND_0309980 [Babesia bigemina]
MAPKNLTDCPENLREAIDWLIQVRHGNGDKNGLDELAKALKKLIEEAIEKAYTTNFDALLKLLHSAKSYTCCKEKVTEIEGFNDSKNNAPRSFEELKSKSEGIKNCYKGHLDSSQQKAYDEIQSKLEQLKSLNESLKGITVEKNCKELLTNLCDGLETFLGFSSDSKGYTGQGIVYSDLDRLCDAVMAFFHGVLSNIQGNLGQHNGQIDEAIRFITANIHGSKDSFNKAINAVVDGVRNYNREVKASNEKITLVITTLSGQMKSYSKDALNKILPGKNELGRPLVHSSEKIQEAVEAVDKIRETECKKPISEFFIDMLKADKDIKDLSPELKIQIENAKNLVKEHAAWLSSIHKHQKSDRDGVIKHVEKQLEDARDQIKERIRSDINKLLDDLIRRVQSILQLLKRIEKNVQQYVNDLDLWIMEADAIVREAESKVDRILEEVDNPAKCKEEVKAAAEYIKGHGLTLHEKFTELKDKYNNVFTIIKGKEGDGEDDTCVVKKLSDAQTKVNEPDDLETWRDDNGNWDVSNSIDPLIRKIKENFSNYLDTLNDALAAGVAEQKGITVNADSTPALDVLVDNVGEYELKNKLGNLGTLLETAKLDKDDGGLGNNIEKVLKHLYEAKKGWNARKHISDIYHTLKASMQEKITAVNRELGQLLQAAAITGAANLHSAVMEIVSSDFKTIEMLNGDIVIAAQETQSMIDNKAEEVKTNLHKLCEIVKIYAEGGEVSAKGKLLELKKKMGKTAKGTLAEGVLRKIHNDIDAILRGDLKDSIRETTEFLSHAEQEKKNTIQVLQHLVTTTIDGARDTITDDIKTRYVQLIKAQLTAFADKVSTAIAPLPNEITADADKGVKGFMRVMQDKLRDSGLNTVLDEYATLQTLSRRAKTFFTELPKTLNTRSKIMPPDYLSKLQNKLHPLFTGLTKYNRKFVAGLTALNSLLTEMNSKSYAHQNNPLLEYLKQGITDMHGELDKAYVSVYDGAEPISQWVDGKNKLTTDGKHGAKVCITILEMLFNDFNDLRIKCNQGNEYKYKTVCARNGTVENPLGAFLARCGYVVSEENKQNGELRYMNDFRGQNIHDDLLTNKHGIGDAQYKLVSDDDEKEEIKVDGEVRVKTTNLPDHGVLRKLLGYLHDYYRVCHFATSGSKKLPCNIYDMLIWLSGLPHNPVYHELTFSSFDELFDKPEEQNVDVRGTVISLAYVDNVSFAAYPETIKVSQLTSALGDVCSKSHSVLTAIVGHGHSDGVYACDYNTNEYKLQYPNSASACFDMLVDVLYRVYHQLNFLYNQCCDTTEVSGWRHCWYGNAIGGSSWKCNELQCPDQPCNPTCNQTCRQHPKCGLKSPLQSFLEDGLPGFLPHQFEKPGCKLECTVPNHRGIPCKTPMGFSDIATTASHRQSGRYLCTVLADFCGGKDSCLSKICSLLICLLNRPPQTLDEMFAFYYHLLNEWNGKSGAHEAAKKHKKYAFEDAVRKASFGFYGHLDNTTIFKSRNHKTHTNGDLFTLVCSDISEVKCGRYIKPLSHNIWTVFSQKHAARYLSWVVYLTETFYNLLNRLLNECIATCGEGNKCYVKCCAATCPVKSAYASKTPIIDLIDKHHTQDCKSITHCPSTRPTLSKYGLVFRSPYDLSGVNNVVSKRTCKDFCYALETVLNKEMHLERALAKFVFETIPEFLFRIREPFIWTVVALWSLSLLYLSYVLIGRLDTLHIKSHLRSPASYKIAAQSLLAAARVGKIAKISYLQA